MSQSPRATECYLPGVAFIAQSHILQLLPHRCPCSVFSGQAGHFLSDLCPSDVPELLHGSALGRGDLVISPVWLQDASLSQLSIAGNAES